jgi:hypothetical protein
LSTIAAWVSSTHQETHAAISVLRNFAGQSALAQKTSWPIPDFQPKSRCFIARNLKILASANILRLPWQISLFFINFIC